MTGTDGAILLIILALLIIGAALIWAAPAVWPWVVVVIGLIIAALVLILIGA